MGKVRRFAESVAIMGLWCAVTAVTGCSVEEVNRTCHETVAVMEDCGIQVPEFLTAEVLPEGVGVLWQELAARG